MVEEFRWIILSPEHTHQHQAYHDRPTHGDGWYGDKLSEHRDSYYDRGYDVSETDMKTMITEVQKKITFSSHYSGFQIRIKNLDPTAQDAINKQSSCKLRTS